MIVVIIKCAADGYTSKVYNVVFALVVGYVAHPYHFVTDMKVVQSCSWVHYVCETQSQVRALYTDYKPTSSLRFIHKENGYIIYHKYSHFKPRANILAPAVISFLIIVHVLKNTIT